MRNKLFLTVLLFFTAIFCNAQQVFYTESNTSILNPERGLYLYHSFDSTTDALPNLTTMKNNGISLLWYNPVIGNFRNSAITTAFLNKLQADFNAMRTAGVKCILRFCYSNNDSNDATKARILAHIDQLKVVVNVNQDVISSVEAGFVGNYGEWYYSDNFGTDSLTAQNLVDRNQIANKIMELAPKRMIAFRTPFIMRNLAGTNPMQITDAYTGTILSRTSFHDDCWLFLDYGSYTDYPTEAAYLENQTKFSIGGGETCGTNPQSGCTSAIQMMEKYHFNYLNSAYAPQNWTQWQNQGCKDEIIRRLGYRFVLLNSTLDNAAKTLVITLENKGFGNLLNERYSYLIYKNTVTGETFTDQLNNVPRFWMAGGNNYLFHNLNQTLPAGTYDLYLNLPDKDLPNDPRYSIQFANVVLWDAATGWNKLNQQYVVAAGCSVSTTWNGSAWSNGVPTVLSTAIINSPLIVNSFTGFDCCELIVNSNLTVQNNAFVTVQNDIHVNSGGNLLVQSGGKLIPVSDTSLCYGNVTVQRTTTPLKQYDYTYFGSSVQNATVSSIFPATNWEANYTLFTDTSNFYDVETSYNGTFISNVPDGHDDSDDFWYIASGIIPQGKGIAAMVKSGGTFPRTETVSFTGVLNTGVINVPIYLSQNTTDNTDDYNFVSNVFSSSVFAPQFINENLANISGTLLYWTHDSTLSSSYPGLEALNFTNEYAYYNLMGGTASAFGGKVPTDYIASCQGFFIEAENSANLVWKPQFLAAGYSNSTNSTFFRQSEIIPAKKIWLSLSNSNNLYSQQLIGYNSESSLNYEKGWDSRISIAKNPIKFYSIQIGEKFKIQSRGEFNDQDIVPLGFESAVAGEFTVVLDSISGLENVYLKEGENIHSLPHTFYTEVGTFDNRFELVFDSSLGLKGFSSSLVTVLPNPVRNVLYITLNKPNDYKYELFDISGRKINGLKRENNSFDVSFLSVGEYFLVVYSEKSKKVYKFVKK